MTKNVLGLSFVPLRVELKQRSNFTFHFMFYEIIVVR
jgi:hypothetical protein